MERKYRKKRRNKRKKKFKLRTGGTGEIIYNFIVILAYIPPSYKYFLSLSRGIGRAETRNDRRNPIKSKFCAQEKKNSLILITLNCDDKALQASLFFPHFLPSLLMIRKKDSAIKMR